MEDLEEMVELFRSIVISGQFVGGAEVESFEKEFAGFCGTSESVAVSTGTDALRFALMAAGIGNNDLVLTAPNTFIATTEAITQAGAAFDFVDIDEKTYTIDPEALSEYFKRSSRPVKAIIPVHLYGQMADMDPILTLAAENGAIVIEDASRPTAPNTIRSSGNAGSVQDRWGLPPPSAFIREEPGSLGKGRGYHG